MISSLSMFSWKVSLVLLNVKSAPILERSTLFELVCACVSNPRVRLWICHISRPVRVDLSVDFVADPAVDFLGG